MEQHPGHVPELAGRVIAIRPKLHGQENAFRSFCRLLKRLVDLADHGERATALEAAREEIQSSGNDVPTRSDVALKFACSVVADMVAQGWEVSVTRNGAELRAPDGQGVSTQELKERVRAGHLLERDAQLREPSVKEFVRSMEQRRLGPRGWSSVFSLMRDGRELSKQLTIAATQSGETERLDALRATVSPYLQLAEAGAVCEFTGLKLAEIWRYFRHTWVSTYKSLPGRSMTVLIRDAAAPNHPVIGIAALGSSMAQQTLRDRWIGWDSDTFLERLVEKPTATYARWVEESLERLVGSLYLEDLLKDGVISRRDLRVPSDDAIERLLADSAHAAEEHRRFPEAAQHKSAGAKPDWKKRAVTPLFRAKRAKTLALLLGIRAALVRAGMSAPTAECLRAALSESGGRRALRQLVRLVKAEHVGVDMMDVIVCGAVAPYNALLGGKLVCLLLGSPELVRFYQQRYSEQESVIASAMKGRAVARPPNLVLLATTSLYGVGSSQYNRIKVPLAELGRSGTARLEYVNLGVSKGYGSYHFSRASIDYLETLLGRAGGGRKVNSIFGEGVNPLMRKLREGLAIIGFPPDDLLNHGNPRVVYCAPLAENFREVLLGLNSRPKYLLPISRAEEQTAIIAEYWRRRWLLGRVSRPGVLDAVAAHTLAYPVTHGARVPQRQEGDRELF